MAVTKVRRDVLEDGGTAALLDAIPDATAVLDADGTIVAVNHAWQMFSVDNGGDPARTGVGVNYFAVCDRAVDAGCEDAVEVRERLDAVLGGDSVDSDLDYPCPSPTVGRWFNLRATRITGHRHGLLISHVNISRRKMAEADLERRATSDPLTGLGNRRRFTERLATALVVQPSHPRAADVGVIFLDLDGFKPVNDTYGHAAGDEVLQTVASRLRSVVRPESTVARMGGDEFAVLSPRTTAEGMAALAGRIGDALSEPYSVHGERPSLGASVGTYLATAGETAPVALEHADQAMYEAKRARKAARSPVPPR